MGGASNFFTKTLTNGSITILAIQKVMKVSILTRQGSVSFIGDADFDGMEADIVTMQTGQGITITARGTGLPIDNFTIIAGTPSDIADIILSY
jgi:hypothetical protein